MKGVGETATVQTSPPGDHKTKSRKRLPIGCPLKSRSQRMGCELGGGGGGAKLRHIRGSAASHTETAERPREFNKQIAFIFNFGMIGLKACPRRLSDGLLTTIEGKQKNQRNLFFTSDVWLLISLKDSNIHKAVLMKIFCVLSYACRWAIRPIWWISCFDLTLDVWPDLTPFFLDISELTRLVPWFVRPSWCGGIPVGGVWRCAL